MDSGSALESKLQLHVRWRWHTLGKERERKQGFRAPRLPLEQRQLPLQCVCAHMFCVSLDASSSMCHDASSSMCQARSCAKNWMSATPPVLGPEGWPSPNSLRPSPLEKP